MPSNKPQLKTYIDSINKAKFSYISKDDNRSDSNLLEKIVLNFINDYENEHGELLVDENGNVSLARPKLEGKSSTTKIG